MPLLIDDLDIPALAHQVRWLEYRSTPFEVYESQPILRVSLTLPNLSPSEVDPTFAMPAILDSGHTPAFSIGQEDLQRCRDQARGIYPNSAWMFLATPVSVTNAGGQTSLVPRLAADIWIHSSRGGSYENWTTSYPQFRPIRLAQIGVVAYVDPRDYAAVPNPPIGQAYADIGTTPGPRLPLIGLTAFRRAGFDLSIILKGRSSGKITVSYP